MSKKRPQVSAPTYEATSLEREGLAAYLARQKEQKPTPRVKITEKNGTTQIAIDHPDAAVGQALLMKALGTSNFTFFEGLLGHLVNAGSQGQSGDERGVNFMLAVVAGIQPRDQIETMLAAQMAAVHSATMTFARRLAHVENIPQQDSAERAFNKLARTFAAQVETLKRYRTGGQQRVTVEHVTVNQGGQAIVGHVGYGGRGTPLEGKPTP